MASVLCANSGQTPRRPLGRLILIILGGVAEFERELILASTTEGRARAVAQGVRLAARENSPGRRPAKR
ncbi:recombinase family protein [Bradyrhizobium sp. Cp5.3]|uniref:recombinase family protein n=1 Tax=Bradyrhizobium sp. Cp5.3 TaxID=443598 RepID=UPI001FD919A2|nr:recombinase family protein [Bradyrhizobium sp. Cp5.3]